MSVAEIFEQMKAKIDANPAKAAGLKASYQFELTGEDGGTYHATFDGTSYDIGPGAVENPGCTVVISAADFTSLVTGKLNPTAAFMGGKLKIKGDMGLAMKLQSIL